MMNFRNIAAKSSLANYGRAIRNTPREVVFNRNLILSAILYAMSAIPASEYDLVIHIC